MRFLKNKTDLVPIEDTVFAIVKKAAQAKQEVGEEQVVDATIGSLYDEDAQLVAMHSVFSVYDALPAKTKAKYADSFTGNTAFREQVKKWILPENGLDLSSSVIATPGGTGAVDLCIEEFLDEKETVILPEIAWGSYALMAKMANLQTKTYTLFEGDHFHLDSFQAVCEEVMQKQEKLVVVINDPCHNPTGYSMTKQEWEAVIAFLNACSKKVPVILVNDVAYIDYSYQGKQAKDYMHTFASISDHVMIVIAFSCSKSLTFYGMRCGAAVILGKQEKDVRDVEIVFEKCARAKWSNVNNAAMETFTRITTTEQEAYETEKASYTQLLKERSEIFLQEADAVGLAHYPYKEGFFITLQVEDEKQKDAFHEALMQEHIYTVKVKKGIRIAICSLPKAKCMGLAKRIKDVWDHLA